MKFPWSKPKFLAMAEYWVYQMGTESPPQDKLMERVVRSPGISGREGLLFSDIRLHSGLVLRAKNPHVFRPDLFAEFPVDPQLLSLMPRAQSFVKARYVSEEPLADDRHLRFLPNFAAGVAALGDPVFIYDAVAQRVWTPEDFKTGLGPDPERFDFQVRVDWVPSLSGGEAKTWGLRKKGFPEIVTAPSPADMAHLVTHVLEEYAHSVWDGEPKTTIEAYGDEFEVAVTPQKSGELQARIHRRSGR